ncbi:hypothetical protein [Mangrovibacterium diazotrophicum]|uniref:Lipoprotein n=1 Tax=Mangrovibacterium diazotrophicum TaxID=1261403 RepID=A0A419WBJ2_9BACT|nr:hypothetical protein [Mangrovibacterium diazotrophicum]RKD92851.1 hypothetical protein BC643_3228 [Mangrovibacterium diazotrophicum]
MKTIKLFFIAMLATAMLAGCGDDDEGDSNPANYFKVDGKTYELKVGYLQNWGTDEGYYEGYNLDLVLVSDGFSFDMESYELTGIGDAVYFEMFTTESTGLDAGEYEYSSTEPYPTGSFDYGEYYVGFDIETEDYESYGYFTAGTVTVSKSGSTYQISFSCTTSTGKKVTGYFKGILTSLDYDLYGTANRAAKKISFAKN